MGNVVLIEPTSGQPPTGHRVITHWTDVAPEDGLQEPPLLQGCSASWGRAAAGGRGRGVGVILRSDSFPSVEAAPLLTD